MPVTKGGTFLQISIEGARDIQGRFARATEEVIRAHRDEMRELGRRVVTALRREVPVKTGRLRRGIGFKTYERGKELEVKVTSAAPYTQYVIRGRGPVVAIHAKVLRFEIGGKVLYRKRVGPAKANPFHRRAFASLGGETTAAARRIAGRVKAAFEAG